MNDKHAGTFKVECCGQRRAIVKGVVVCRFCDFPLLIPNWDNAQVIPNNVRKWVIQ